MSDIIYACREGRCWPKRTETCCGSWCSVRARLAISELPRLWRGRKSCSETSNSPQHIAPRSGRLHDNVAVTAASATLFVAGAISELLQELSDMGKDSKRLKGESKKKRKERKHDKERKRHKKEHKMHHRESKERMPLPNSTPDVNVNDTTIPTSTPAAATNLTVSVSAFLVLYNKMLCKLCKAVTFAHHEHV